MICTPGILKQEPTSHTNRPKEPESQLEEKMGGTIMMTKPELIFPGRKWRAEKMEKNIIIRLEKKDK